MTMFRVFYTVTHDGYLDIEADSRADAVRTLKEDTEDQDLVYNANREDLIVNDVQDPETGAVIPEEED